MMIVVFFNLCTIRVDFLKRKESQSGSSVYIAVIAFAIISSSSRRKGTRARRQPILKRRLRVPER